MCETLNETGINPGPQCTSYEQKQDQKVSADKQRKSTTKFKIRRGQLGLNRFKLMVINQNGEGLSYEHNFDLKDVCANCFCVSLLRTKFICHVMHQARA